VKKLTKKENDYFYKLFEYKSIRTYLDLYSSEFQKNTYTDKLNLFLKIKEEKIPLEKLIAYFNSIYLDNNSRYLHLKGCIEETLMEFVLYIETGKGHQLLPIKYKNLSLTEIIDLFEKKLTEYSKKDSLSDNSEIQLSINILKKLERQDKSKKIDYPNSSIHLYNFLTRNIFPALKENSFDQYFMIDMGCSSNVLKYLKHFEQETANKEITFKRAKAVEIASEIVSELLLHL
jgi:hypothetical protein